MKLMPSPPPSLLSHLPEPHDHIVISSISSRVLRVPLPILHINLSQPSEKILHAHRHTHTAPSLPTHSVASDPHFHLPLIKDPQEMQGDEV